jgi:hypothetical protein
LSNLSLYFGSNSGKCYVQEPLAGGALEISLRQLLKEVELIAKWHVIRIQCRQIEQLF